MHAQQLVIALLSLSLSISAAPTPKSKREITINHSSSSTGSHASHVIDPSLLSPELAKAIKDTNVNINLNTDRERMTREKRADTAVKKTRSAYARGLGPRAINNSTINLTSISKRDSATKVGAHSVHVDGGAIKGSTVHVNILPVRDTKQVGDHSILISSSSPSSSSSNGETASATVDAKEAGHHSAVVEAESIDDSTINLTIVTPKNASSSDSTPSTPAPASDAAPAPASGAAEEEAQKLVRRGLARAWVRRINATKFAAHASTNNNNNFAQSLKGAAAII